jgi:D-galactarolactone cycloisomerase
MTIASICTHLLKHKLATAYESASMRLDRSRCVLVEVICDYGIPDIDARVGPDRETTIETDANCLVCQTALETNKIWTLFHNSWHHKGPTIMARDCNDIAPWDIERRHFRVKISSYAGRPRQLAKTYDAGRINKNSSGRRGDNASKMAGHEIDRFEGSAVLEYVGSNHSVRAGQPIVIAGREIWRPRRHISTLLPARNSG